MNMSVMIRPGDGLAEVAYSSNVTLHRVRLLLKYVTVR